MKNIISASRRTDIPAYFGDWFMSRIREGAAGYVNPFGGQKHTVSLRPEDVLFIVFWSKNFAPFLDALDVLDGLGYKFYFQFTITGHPELLENNTPPWRQAVETAHRLARRFSPEQVLWRFDPIVFSSATPPEYALETFERLAKALEGATRRCYFSYVCYYGKVRANFVRMNRESSVSFFIDGIEEQKIVQNNMEADDTFVRHTSRDEKAGFARELAAMAARRGITMHTCCGDYLIRDHEPRIFKAHCVDGELISQLIAESANVKLLPTREDCGCYQSRDIGAYDSCAHGCVYCYANVNKETAARRNAALREKKDAFALHLKASREDFPV